MNNKGFTLVEIISVITILGLLVIITTPAYDTISKNIKQKNYDSKINTIKSQTLSYVEKYLKDKVYDGTNHYYCFTIEYLIQNGIISSDSDEEEYIENNVTGEKYSGNLNAFIQISYDTNKLKLNAITEFDNDDCDYIDNKGA